MVNGRITNDKIYEALDRVRVESKSDTLRLEGKVDNLTRDVSDLKIKEAITATKVATIAVTASLVITIAMNIIAWKLFGFPGAH